MASSQWTGLVMNKKPTHILLTFLALAVVAGAPLEQAQANTLSTIWKAVKTAFRIGGDEAVEAAGRGAREAVSLTEREISQVMMNYPPILRSGNNEQQLFIDLTLQSYRGELMTGAARDLMLRDLKETLLRRQGHAVLVGEAGVGKSQVIADLTQEITRIDSNLPEQLRNTRVVQLDRNAITRGSSVHGNLEATLEDLREVISNLRPEQQEKLVVVIEDLGDWWSFLEGVSGGSNIFFGRLQDMMQQTRVKFVFTATEADLTMATGKFQKFGDLLSRIDVQPPTFDEAFEMVRVHLPRIEAHHGVNFPSDTVKTAIRMADRFVTRLKLPGSALELLENAALHTRLNTTTRPRDLVDIDSKISVLRRQLAENRSKRGPKYELNAIALQHQLDALSGHKEFLEIIHSEVLQFVQKIDAKKLELSELNEALARTRRDADKISIQQQINEINAEIEGYNLGVRERTANIALGTEVNERALAEVIARERRTSAQEVMQELGREASFMDRVTADLQSRIVGQRHVIDTILKTLGANRDRAANGVRGAFLFVGASRTGKTEFARALGDVYGTPILKLDAANYTTETAVNRLIGADPGYVGYESGGLLTNYIRTHATPVILVDEVEKGGKELVQTFLAAMEYSNPGLMPKKGGTFVSTRDSIFIFTGNLLGPHDPFAQAAVHAGKIAVDDFADDALREITDAVEMKERLQKTLRELRRTDGSMVMSDELLNRMDFIFKFYEFTPEEMVELVASMSRGLVNSLDDQAIGLALNNNVLEALALRAGRDTRNSSRVRTNINQFVGSRVNTLTATKLSEFGEQSAEMALKEGDILHVTLKSGASLDGVEAMEVMDFQRLLDFHVISHEARGGSVVTVIRSYSFDGGNPLKRVLTSDSDPQGVEAFLRNALGDLTRDSRLADPNLPKDVNEVMELLGWSTGR